MAELTDKIFDLLPSIVLMGGLLGILFIIWNFICFIFADSLDTKKIKRGEKIEEDTYIEFFISPFRYLQDWRKERKQLK